MFIYFLLHGSSVHSLTLIHAVKIKIINTIKTKVLFKSNSVPGQNFKSFNEMICNYFILVSVSSTFWWFDALRNQQWILGQCRLEGPLNYVCKEILKFTALQHWQISSLELQSSTGECYVLRFNGQAHIVHLSLPVLWEKGKVHSTYRKVLCHSSIEWMYLSYAASSIRLSSSAGLEMLIFMSQPIIDV